MKEEKWLAGLQTCPETTNTTNVWKSWDAAVTVFAEKERAYCRGTVDMPRVWGPSVVCSYVCCSESAGGREGKMGERCSACGAVMSPRGRLHKYRQTLFSCALLCSASWTLLFFFPPLPQIAGKTLCQQKDHNSLCCGGSGWPAASLRSARPVLSLPLFFLSLLLVLVCLLPPQGSLPRSPARRPPSLPRLLLPPKYTRHLPAGDGSSALRWVHWGL